MSPKLPRVEARMLIKALKQAGFVEKRQRGSHLHLWRAAAGKRVTVPVHQGRTVATGTLRAILRDADISVEAFIELLDA